MVFNFEKGDIVKFIDEANARPDYFHHVENIYQITSIDGSKVILSHPYTEDIVTDISAITAVRMDGKEDRFIYYDPVIMASTVLSGQPIPIHHRKYTYYLDDNVLFPHNKTMRDFINENGFSYVNELQHYLREHYQTDDLKIHI